jgi:hypothetical protein
VRETLPNSSAWYILPRLFLGFPSDFSSSRMEAPTVQFYRSVS